MIIDSKWVSQYYIPISLRRSAFCNCHPNLFEYENRRSLCVQKIVNDLRHRIFSKDENILPKTVHIFFQFQIQTTAAEIWRLIAEKPIQTIRSYRFIIDGAFSLHFSLLVWILISRFSSASLWEKASAR